MEYAQSKSHWHLAKILDITKKLGQIFSFDRDLRTSFWGFANIRCFQVYFPLLLTTFKIYIYLNAGGK